ncbi:MAG: DUF998 domain-containing protein [Gordonia sp. (in: high G+C Gram-positive bacteria)]
MQSERIRGLIAGVALIAAGVCYSSWVFEFVFPAGLDPLRTFLSELDSESMPHRHIYQVGDLLTVAASIIAALALLIYPAVVHGRLQKTAAVAVGVFGVATIADVLTPFSCVPGRDHGCRAEGTGILRQLTSVHAMTSTVAVVALFVTMIAATVAAWRGAPWPLLKYAGLTVLVIIVLATAWMMAADKLDGDYRLGLAQRIEIGGMSVWLVLWGVAVTLAARRARQAPGFGNDAE